MSARVKFVAGNWKMYKNLTEARIFCEKFQNGQIPQGTEVAVFPPLPLVAPLAKEFSKVISFGVQNMHWETQGAFTGELSPLLAKEIGAKFVLAGHSERRQFFGETNESAAKRAVSAHSNGMRAVFCVGEKLEDRDAGKTMDIIRAQCAPLFALSPTIPEGFVFAYEPVWAIGTGRTATSEQAEEVHASLRGEIAKAWGPEAAQKVQILYGGSVKADNAKELMSRTNVDGVLVGGASLDAASFLAIAAGSN